jgi:hypothetical protein
MGFAGSERTTRRAVAHVKKAWRAGRRRAYRPWIPEPGMWLQFDWGIGPLVADRQAWLWCAWLAWSRFRVVLPVWDRTVPSVLACLDATLRRLGGAPTYVLTDNEKTVTVDRIAGVAVRHPEMVAAGGHYGCAIATCEPADPESKGGSEHTVKLAKADVVPTEANLLDEYANFGELQAACEAFCDRVNQRVHRETARRPAELLAEERSRLHPVPAEPYAAALGETRRVGADQTVRWHSVRYSTPPGHVGGQVWCRVHGDELVITAHTDRGLVEIARHALSTPGSPQIADAHYPAHDADGGRKGRPQPTPTTEAERAFLALGDGAQQWLIEAGAAGVERIPTKMGRAVELACVVGDELVDRALGVAAAAGRFDTGDLASITDHLAAGGQPHASPAMSSIDEAHSAQPGTRAWEEFGR